MFNISQEGIIELSRGDSAVATLVLQGGTNFEPTVYKVGQLDKIYFAILEPNQKFEDAVVKKCYGMKDVDEDGNILIKINPQDTENLLTGVYHYTVKLESFNQLTYESVVQTVVPEKEFYLDN